MFDPIKAIIDFTAHASVSADPEAKPGIDGAVAFVGNLLEKELAAPSRSCPRRGIPWS
jgi:hypothetical protein